MANFCSRCGSLVFPGSDSCPSCGAYVSGESRTKQRSLTEIAAQRRPAPRTVSEEDMKAPYLPYEPRPSQLSIISDIREAMDAGRHIVIESGTGTGKTIVSLAAALEHSKPRNKKVVYLTRTISQSDQVMRELKAISSLKRVTGIAVTGRGKSCLLMRTVRGYESLPPQVLSSICEEKKSKRACPYFNTLRDHMAEVESFCLSEFPKSDKLDEFCESLGTCPYEMKKLLMKGMDVVVAPYVHILSEDIRSNLLNNLDSDGGNLTIVIDEAHNLVDAAREQESFSISLRLVQSALDECSTIRGGDAMLCDGVMLVPFITHLKNLMRSLATSKLGLREKEALLGDVVSSLGQRDNGIYEEIFHSPSPSSPDFGYADFASAGDSISSDAGIVIYTEKKLSEAVAGAGRVDEALKYIMSRSIELRDSLPPLSLPLKNLIFDHTGASVGQKINPFYKVNSMHEGLDFVVPSGTPVYAPADGVVLSVTRSTRGAGNVVEIDHGNGFLTRYAHLQEIHVRKGRLIGKGDRIGLSGMSGKSFGPHLHYEVWRDGKVMDPLNFFFADLTPEEYAGMMALGTSIAQSMD